MDVDIAALVRTALEEDVGDGDVTTLATVDAEARAEALITQKAPGTIYGLDAAEAVFAQLDPGLPLRAAGGGGGVARAGGLRMAARAPWRYLCRAATMAPGSAGAPHRGLRARAAHR